MNAKSLGTFSVIHRINNTRTADSTKYLADRVSPVERLCRKCVGLFSHAGSLFIVHRVEPMANP